MNDPMNARGASSDRSCRAAAAALFAGVLLAGCASSPRTHFDWGLNARPHRREARVAIRHDDDFAPRTVSVVPRPRPVPGWYQPVRTADLAAPAPDFIWPVNGDVISGFGPHSDGQRNDGINIAVPEGEPIHAAASGIVTYAGDALKSYGNLVLIRHADGYVTAYAHAARLLVARGDHVTKGQVIGYSGDTGDVSRPQLHFEIRRGVEPVNPRPLLVASR